jgi:hypothetical protein
MTKSLWHLLCFALLILVFSPTCKRKQSEPLQPRLVENADFLFKSEGEAELRRGPGLAFGAVQKDDELVCENTGHFTLFMPNEQGIEAMSRTRLRFGEVTRDGLSFSLQSGEVISRSKGAGVSVTVNSPFGLIRTRAEAHEVKLSLGEGLLLVDVRMGTIEVVDSQKRSIRVTPGQIVEVSLGGVRVVSPNDENTLPVSIEAVGSGVTIKSGDAAPRSFEGTSNLRGNDVVVVSRGSSAQLLADGFTAKLGVDVSTSVEQVKADGDQTNIFVAQGSGSNEYELSDSKIVLSIKHEDSYLPIRASGKTSRIRVSKGDFGLTVVAKNGAFLARDAFVGERQMGWESHGTFKVGRRKPADLVLPERLGLTVNADSLSWVTMNFEGDTSKRRVKVALDPKFSRLILDGEIEKQLTVAVSLGQTLYWQAAHSAEKGSARFKQATGLGQFRPNNKVMETGKQSTVNFQGASPMLTFEFEKNPAASKHVLRLYRLGNLKEPAVETPTQTNKATVDASELSEGDYVWRAEPLDANGRSIAGGRMNPLRLVFQNVAAQLTLYADERLPGGVTSFSGVAPLGKKLFTNGKITVLDAKGRFQLKAARDTTLVFRLEQTGSPDTYWVRNTEVDP